MRSSERRISRPMAAKAVRVKRNESQPYLSIMASGSMTLPVDLDILRPEASRTRACRYTSLNGTSPIKWMPIIIMRATQKNRMSKPVTSTEVGYQRRRSLVSSGQPMVEKGHRADENHVSSTSSSCLSAPPHLGHTAGASSATTISPQDSQFQAGMRWPHHIWRLMHQSRMLSSQ